MMVWSRNEGDGAVVTVTVPDRETLLSEIAERFDQRRGFSIATLNLDHAVKLQRDPAFRAAYAAQTHVTADGNPIVWLSRLAGQSNVRLAPGSELVVPVADVAARHGVPVGLLGSTEATLAQAAARLAELCEGLEVTMTLAPAMGFDPEGPEADEAIARIRESGARLVFLALGAPKQERFAVRAQKALPEVGFFSIGAGLDFIAGHQTRAPAWVRAIAAEWLWRMLGDPVRLARRYAACIAALPGLTLRAALSRRPARS